MTTKSAIAATTTSDPAIGAASNEVPFVSTTATPAGNRIAPIMGRRNQSIIKSKEEQQHAADQVEMGVRGREQEVLLDAHRDAGQHPEQ